MNEKIDQPVARDQFIAAMRSVAASVTVVTTQGSAGCLGATVSAFSSVSADPPTVLICLFAESRIAKAVVENRKFSVNVLPENAQHIADRFAGRHDNEVSDRFQGIECFDLTGRGLAISGATTFSCDVSDVVRSGSHLIIIGNVQSVSNNADRPLAYRDGAYQRVIENKDAVRSS